jgi:hypothetical protein
MAVVNRKSNLFRDAAALGAIPMPNALRGVVRHAVGSVANVAGDSNNSSYLLASVPSHAIMHPNTLFDVQNWGFAQAVIGSKAIQDQILDVAKSAATTQSPFAFGDANHGKELWDVLGMAADPGGTIEIYAHAEANATGAGTMPFCIAWIDNA